MTGTAIPAVAALREPVHPRRNVEDFAPVDARFVRFTIRSTNRGEPCLDELEVYGPDDSRNLALAAAGSRASASGSLPDYGIHQIEWVNDGRYGNGRSWIADRHSNSWVQVELPQVTRINKVVWGRDREGNFIDRLVTGYTIEVAHETNAWRTVASSDDREPLGFGAQLTGGPSLRRSFVNRFAPVGTRLSTETELVTPEYSIDVWQTSDGLPANTVTSIAQALDGFLWIGTLNGLARFDGLEFKVFGEGSALPNSRVLSLLAARDGTLWIGTDGGGLVSLREGSFRSWAQKNGHDTISDLAEDAAGRVWAATAAGLSCWANGGFVTNESTRSAWEAGGAVEVDATGALWAVVGSQLRTQSSTNVLGRPDAPEPSSFSSVLALHTGASGQAWFGGANGYIGAVSNGIVNVFHEQPGHLLEAIWTLCEARRGDVWAGTASGGLRRLRDGTFTSVTTQDGLSDNAVRCVYEDREGSLWVGTVGGGLNRLKERKLRTFTTRDGLTHNVVMSLAEAEDGTLWVGSNCGGLSARRNGVFSAVSANYLLDNECIWSVLPARDGSLWIGTWGGGLFRLRGRDGEEQTRGVVENFPIVRPGDDEPVLSLCGSASGGVWVGTMQAGLKLFRDGEWRAHGATNLPSHAITALVEDPDGTLWIATSGGGLSRFKGGQIATGTRRDGLPSDFIRTIHRDSKSVLWVGTGAGLARLRKGESSHEIQFDSFTRAEGLPDEVISQILEDDRGNLWLGCNQGIVQVPRQQIDALASGESRRLSPILYGRAEGMESIECTGGFHPAGAKTRDGKLWFSTVKGVVMIDPQTISANEVAPPVVLEEIAVSTGSAGSQRTSMLPITSSTTAVRPQLELPSRLQRLEFRFSGLSFVAPERNRFKYRLEGFDATWVEGAQRVATYTHLPPGRYVFRVLASNNDGVWNQAGATFAFAVLPAFWQTWWFRVLLGTVVLGGSGALVRYVSVRRLRRKLRLLEQKHVLEKERTRIAQDIHDELGASLTRIALLSELGQKHREQPSEIAADLSKISSTAREAVRAMDAIVWAVNPHNDSLDHFANYISHFAEDFFRLSPIHCRLDIPEDLPEQPLSTDARHQLFLAVKEALNNAMRHSGATEVWVRLRCVDRQLHVNVEDNGCGLPVGEPGPGHDGISNIRQRLERLGGQLEVSSQRGQGTALSLRLPMHTDGARGSARAGERAEAMEITGNAARNGTPLN